MCWRVSKKGLEQASLSLLPGDSQMMAKQVLTLCPLPVMEAEGRHGLSVSQSLKWKNQTCKQVTTLEILAKIEVWIKCSKKYGEHPTRIQEWFSQFQSSPSFPWLSQRLGALGNCSNRLQNTGWEGWGHTLWLNGRTPNCNKVNAHWHFPRIIRPHKERAGGCALPPAGSHGTCQHSRGAAPHTSACKNFYSFLQRFFFLYNLELACLIKENLPQSH